MATGDHFYTTNQAERDNALAQFGYVDEGVACYVYGYQASGTIPLYRLFNWDSNDHFYTTSRPEADNAVANGYSDEGIACFVFSSQASGTTPFYRLYNPNSGDHFYTTSRPEADNAVVNGYSDEGIACYVFRSQLSGTQPLYRLFKVADIKSCVKLHFKVLTSPNIPIDTMVNAMRQVYTTAGVLVDIVPFGSYNDEGVACYIYDYQASGTIPLYRLYNPNSGDHFYTTSRPEADNAMANGYTDEGIACFVFSSQASGTTPFYRLYNPNSGDHFYTTSRPEADNAVANGYSDEGVACYVFSSQTAGVVPLYRLFSPHSGDHFYTTSVVERYNTITAELLDLPLLNNIDIGRCVRGSTTQDQRDLFNNRQNAGKKDIVIYFVQSTIPPSNGCAAHPKNRPGAVVARGATRWTLAHESGHVLGLNHLASENCSDPTYTPTRLMTGCGTGLIVGTPTLSDDEIKTMDDSSLTINV